MVARAEEELRTNIDRSLLVRRKRDWGIPIEPKFLVIVRSRLDVACFMGVPIYAADFAALVLGIDIVWVGRVGKHPESIAAVHIFPAMIGNATWILRIAY